MPPVAVQDHLERVQVLATGEVRRDVNVTLTEDEYRRMWEGYTCCRCYARVTEPFPVTCGFPGCDGYPEGFPMRERQREVMEAEFDGEEWIGISRATYEAQQNVEPQTTRAQKSRIWVPGKD